MKQISDAELSQLRNKFLPGTRVRLVKMKDFHAPPVGSCGTVRLVDDAGTVHVAWDAGWILGVDYYEDKIEKT